MPLRLPWRLAVAAALAVGPSIADGARRSSSRNAAEDPAQWEQPGGRDQARLEFAHALLRAGSPDACLELIAQLRRDGMKGLELERLHAEALRATGLDDDARAVLEGVVRRWPRDAAAHNELGILAMDRDDRAQAIEHFRLATRHDQDNARYLNNLGFALLVDEQHDAAIDVLRSALRANSARDLTRNNLGFALVAAGRTDEAWRVFRAASGDAADAHYNVGVGLELRGARAEATAAYRKAIDSDPQHAHAQAALSRLAEPAPAPPVAPDPALAPPTPPAPTEP